MAYKRPDVYIEEILTPELAPQGVSTSIASFVGATKRGPANKAIFIDSFDSFKRVFGDTAVDGESMFYSVRTFFENGGSACYIVRAVSSAQLALNINPANDTLTNEAGGSLLKVSAGYRGESSYGLEGKNLSISISEIGQSAIRTANMVNGQSSVEVNNLSGFKEGDIVLVAGTLATNAAATPDYLKIESMESVIEGGLLKHKLNFTSAITLASTLTANTGSIKVLAYDLTVKNNNTEVESYSRLSLDPSSDSYVETVINDEQTGSRFIKVEDLQPSAEILSNVKQVGAGELSVESHGLLDNGETELTSFSIATDLNLALKALDAKDSVNLLCVPPSISPSGIFPSSSLNITHALMLDYVKYRMDMFAILDAPSGKTADSAGSGSIGDYRTLSLGVDSFWGALYYPHIKVPKVLGKTQSITIPPSGAIAGLYSRVDAIGAPTGGVASAPAGIGEFGRLDGILNVEVEVSETQHGDLNVMGINCLRILDNSNTGVSVNVLGARTLSSGLDFRYLNVRRMMNFIEKRVKNIGEASLFRNNGPDLWAKLTSEIESFLTQRFEAGELAGNSTSEAFFVKIDSSNNTADNIRQGILVGEIGVALLRPAEFIVFKFSQVQVG